MSWLVKLFTRRLADEEPVPQTMVDALNDLDTRLGRLEGRDLEARVQQLAVMEKVLRAVNARVQRRIDREEAAEDAPQATNEDGASPGVPDKRFAPSAHLATRFRRF